MLGERASLGRGNSMEIRADEISRIIREQIKDYGKRLSVAETGTVLSVGDGITRIYGLGVAEAGQLVQFPDGVEGMLSPLEKGNGRGAVRGRVPGNPDGANGRSAGPTPPAA